MSLETSSNGAVETTGQGETDSGAVETIETRDRCLILTQGQAGAICLLSREEGATTNGAQVNSSPVTLEVSGIVEIIGK